MLTKEQKQVLEIIFSSPISEISTWGGGTALSEIYLQHRKSEDIDIILSDMPPTIELTRLANFIEKTIKATKTESFANMNRFQYVFNLGKDSQLKLEFIYYPFPRLGRTKKWGKVKIESLKDIAVSKALSAYQRVEVKDAIDLYFLLKNRQFNLKELVKGVEKKFNEKIDRAHLLAKLTKSLENFSSIKPMPIKKIARHEIIDYFQSEFNRFVKREIR